MGGEAARSLAKRALLEALRKMGLEQYGHLDLEELAERILEAGGEEYDALTKLVDDALASRISSLRPREAELVGEAGFREILLLLRRKFEIEDEFLPLLEERASSGSIGREEYERARSRLEGELREIERRLRELTHAFFA